MAKSFASQFKKGTMPLQPVNPDSPLNSPKLSKPQSPKLKQMMKFPLLKGKGAK